MKSWIRTRRLVALLGAMALVISACGGGDDDTEAQPTDGETAVATETGTEAAADGDYCANAADEPVIWAHEQEPGDMHLDDPNNNLSITSWVQQSFWEGLFGVSEDLTFFPEMLDGEPTVNENEDGSVTIDYTLRDDLQWSDGEPVTATEIQQQYEMVMAGYDAETGEGGVYLIGDRTGYDTITDFTVDSETEFSITWDPFFSGYKALFARVFPMHVITEGSEDPEEWANTANEAFVGMEMPDGEGFLPATGPMIYDGREQGVSMSLTRNEDYHGTNSPDAQNTDVACATGVTINWVTDTDAQINALKAGEADFVFAQPQVAFGEEIATDDDFTVASSAGAVYEHWGFNLHNPHLEDVNVREAIAYGMDKSQVITSLYSPLFGDLLPEEGLGNTYWMSNQPPYEDHQQTYAGAQVDQANAKLEEAGYTEGSDGIYEHPDKGRLSLRVGTTGGNALRELQQQILVEQLSAAGIEIEIDNVPGADYFSERPFAEQSVACSQSGGEEGDCTIWDITQFAWVGGPWPGSNSAAYRSGSGNNPYGYANEDFDAKAAECDATIDDDERATCYNEADMYVTSIETDPEGLVVVPLTQKPTFYAYTNTGLEEGAIAPDANDAGPLVNVQDFVPSG